MAYKKYERTNTVSTMRQIAYARRTWGAKGVSKKQIALDVGYAPSTAACATTIIERSDGYHNAVAQLAADSNNLALMVMEELKSRGMGQFDNKELISSLKAISGAWKIFNVAVKEDQPKPDSGKNRLKTIVLQNIANQTINNKEVKEEKITDVPVEDNNDF